MADRNVPGILVLLLALLVVVSVALLVLWVVVFDPGALARLLVVVGYFLAFHVYLPYRVYADARTRGSDSAAAWAALTFLLSAVGAAVYFVVSRLLAQWRAA